MFEIYYAEIDSDICCCGVNFERIRDESVLMPITAFQHIFLSQIKSGIFLGPRGPLIEPSMSVPSARKKKGKRRKREKEKKGKGKKGKGKK